MSTLQELKEFGRRNGSALRLYKDACNDYLGYRCCYLNGILIPAYTLAQQAIEKQLKSILLILNPEEKVKKYLHDLKALILKLANDYNFEAKQYLELGTRLSNLYELNRYPGNKLEQEIKEYNMGGAEYEEIDNIFIFLADKSQVIECRKARGQLFTYLFSDNPNLRVYRHWLRKENKALEIKYEEWKNSYDEMMFNRT